MHARQSHNYKMIFVKKASIKSKLSEEEVVKKWNSLFDPKHKWSFEGGIKGRRFMMEPLYCHSPRNRIRPEISGEIIAENDATLIKLNCHLSDRYKILFLGALALNLFVSLGILIDPETFPWWFLLIVVVLTFGIFIGHFNSTTSTAIKIISSTIRG